MVADFNSTVSSAISSYDATQSLVVLRRRRRRLLRRRRWRRRWRRLLVTPHTGPAPHDQHTHELRSSRCSSPSSSIVVLVALVGFVIVGFNKLRTTDIGAQEALGGIDVQLTRRADLIPNLVETVKGYAAHEKGVFEEVTKARAGVAAAAAGRRRPGQGRRRRRAQQALVKVNAVAEAYPDLKANQNFLELQSSSPRPRTRSPSPASTTTTPSRRSTS